MPNHYVNVARQGEQRCANCLNARVRKGDRNKNGYPRVRCRKGHWGGEGFSGKSVYPLSSIKWIVPPSGECPDFESMGDDCPDAVVELAELNGFLDSLPDDKFENELLKKLDGIREAEC